MKSKREIKDWILRNCIDSCGNIDLSYLDFSDFDGNIHINHMKVKHNLSQSNQEVRGRFFSYKLKEYEEWEEGSDFLTCVRKIPKLTKSEIEEKLGYKIEIVRK